MLPAKDHGVVDATEASSGLIGCLGAPPGSGNKKAFSVEVPQRCSVIAIRLKAIEGMITSVTCMAL